MSCKVAAKKNKAGKKLNVMPQYTRGQDLFNAISHIVGGVLGAAFGIAAFIIASFNPTPNKYAAVAVYMVSIITLYTMSALYHFFPAGRAKKVFRIFDHCTIFLLIAGCYTPFCLIPLWHLHVGKAVFFIEWGIAVLGITFNAINMNWKAVKILSQAGYVIMGWLAVFIIPQLLNLVPPACVWWLLAGGVAYTVGIIFFAIGKRKNYMHCVWHIFVIAGSALQFVSLLYLL